MVTSVTSETDIMNSALRKLGAERIISPNDNNNRARLVKESYPQMRDALFRAHPWRFSTAFVSCGSIALPSGVFGYDYAYQLPSDCARVFETNFPQGTKWTEIENNRIVSDCGDGCKARIGRVITDVTKYDAVFVDLLAWAIAADIAYAITQSTAQQKKAEDNFDKQLLVARSYSAQVGSVKQAQTSDDEDWVNIRR